ncbi:MAG: hypothetical protein ABIT16_03595 [Croceibacterium sp.]
MHDWGILIPIAAITIGPLVWAFNNWTRAKHGFEPETYRRRGRRGGSDSEESQKVALLTNENDRLSTQVSGLQERLAVLERIATDPALRTAQQIEALRDQDLIDAKLEAREPQERI